MIFQQILAKWKKLSDFGGRFEIFCPSHERTFKLIESRITGLFVRTNLLLANLPKHCTFLRALRHILERDVVYLTGSPSFKSRLKLRK